MNVKILYHYVNHCEVNGLEPTFEGLKEHSSKYKDDILK